MLTSDAKQQKGASDMREILFRGKRLDTGVWARGDLLRHDGIVSIAWQHPADGSMVAPEVDPASIGQFTGLYDSKRTKEYPKGQMIFEGDMLIVTICHSGQKIKMRVEWEPYSCMFCLIEGLKLWDVEETAIFNLIQPEAGEEPFQAYEVIGNVHDAAANHGEGGDGV